MTEPESTYADRLGRWQLELARRQSRDHAFGNARLGVFVGGLVMAGAWLGSDTLSAYWLALPAAVFTALVIVHQRVLNATTQAQQAIAFYEAGVRRLHHAWAGTGQHDQAAPPDHPFAVDLDLFGEGSLFELLCTTHTRVGQDRLASWLVDAPDLDDIRARQAAVQSMTDGLDRREAQALAAAGQRANIQEHRLLAWVRAPTLFRAERGLRAVAFALSGLSLAGLGVWALTPWGPWPWLVVLSAQWLMGRLLRARLESALGPLDAADTRLRVLMACAAGYEHAHLQAALAAQCQEAVRGAAHAIGKLLRLVVWLDGERNQLFKPLAFMFMWRLQFVLSVERWRAQHRDHLAVWLNGFGVLEALEALAQYAYEHPRDVYPELVATGPLFEGRGIAHPLLATCIANDVDLTRAAPVLIVSGSNMSGKSTLLRTVGINAVLAFCGAPVRAQALRLSPLSLGATLHIQDSLQRGRSRFFAEITRLKQLADLAQGSRPLLFLLDEVLHGTNSHDRRIGARAVLSYLLQHGAIGLVTTHDLALADIAATIGGRNVHFADELHGDEMRFDYTLREGIVQHSNALALMRAVGLSL